MQRKRKKPLLSFTKNKLLHSKNLGKSTYFYSNDGKLSDSKPSNHNFTNGLRVRLSSLRENSRLPKVPSAILTRRSPNSKSPYSKITGWRTSYILPVTCSLALLLVVWLAINPFAQGGGGEKAYAAINEDLGNGSTVSLAIYNNGTEVADDGIVSTNVDIGQVSYISNTIKVTTNKIGKYYVGVQSATTSSELTGADTKATIAGVGNNVTASNFGDNTWGYALTDNTSTADQNLAYSTLPAYSASTTPQYASTQNPDNGEHELKLTFAAKIRADKPADHYQTTALVSVAAEAKAIPSWQDHGLSTMQGMTSSICTAAEEGTTGQLVDTRDSKTYWVTKLKDGNCWMTQNLALNLSTWTPLYSSDSDVSSNWTPSANTQQGTITKFPTTDDSTFSYNPGEYIYTTPIEQHDCGSTSITKLEGCPNWVKVDELSKNDTGDKRAHYLVGNYYSAKVARAGGSNSICPKGWGLPSAGSSGQYTNMIDGLAASVTVTSNNIKLVPYYFVYSGSIGNNSMKQAGGKGVYLSSSNGRIDGEANPYAMSFANGAPSSSGLDALFLNSEGYSVRCVAR